MAIPNPANPAKAADSKRPMAVRQFSATVGHDEHFGEIEEGEWRTLTHRRSANDDPSSPFASHNASVSFSCDGRLARPSLFVYARVEKKNKKQMKSAGPLGDRLYRFEIEPQ